MDDFVRQRRARHLAETMQQQQQDAPSAPEQQEQDSRLFNFGHVGRMEARINTPQQRHPEESQSSSDQHNMDGNSSEADEALMRRQLERPRSQPYSFVPTKASPKETTRAPKQEESHKHHDMPGQFPTSDESNPACHRTEFDTKPEKEESKPSAAPFSADSEKTCRICFSPSTLEDRLISPCKCRGTSKWIHLSCLTQWRLRSRNNKSFYQCDQCHYRYSFRRTQFAEVLLSRYTLLFLTALSFGFSSFIGGFLVKLLLFFIPSEYLFSSPWSSSSFFFFYTPLDAGTDILSAASKLVPDVPTTWRDIFVIDAWHFIQGVISLGVIGVVGVLGTGGIFSLRTFGGTTRRAANGRRRGDGLGFGDFVFIAVILLGCGRVAVTMWKKVKGAVKRRLASLGERILEVDPDRP